MSPGSDTALGTMRAGGGRSGEFRGQGFRMALMKRSLILTALFALGATGCIVVHPGARTVLECRPSADSTDVIRLGFADCTWSMINDHVAVSAYGWHPREHETYAFLCCEPYPARQPRRLLMTQLEASDQFQLELWYTREGKQYHFTGTVSNLAWRSGRTMHVRLRNLNLASPEGTSLLVSGSITADPDTPRNVQGAIDWRRKCIEVVSKPAARLFSRATACSQAVNNRF